LLFYRIHFDRLLSHFLVFVFVVLRGIAGVVGIAPFNLGCERRAVSPPLMRVLSYNGTKMAVMFQRNKNIFQLFFEIIIFFGNMKKAPAEIFSGRGRSITILL